MRKIDLSHGWQVLQDVHDNAERLGLYKPEYAAHWDSGISDWEPLERLTHLQVLFAPRPYYGRELRYFNEHAWWYRLEFDCPADAGPIVRLCFWGVDYFAKVWLNGTLLGEHEGYADTFNFDIAAVVSRNARNHLVVKVSAPWDKANIPDRERDRVTQVIRNQIKGTYEHSDTFIQRDVNPIGIWAPVQLIVADTCCSERRPYMDAHLADHLRSAALRLEWPVIAFERVSAVLRVVVEDEVTGEVVSSAEQPSSLVPGSNRIEAALTLENPRLWSTWDRGGAQLYRARASLIANDKVLLNDEAVFGVRRVTLKRTPEETSLILNGEPMFIRGTTYFPDVYVSQVDRARCRRDIEAAMAAGFNAMRVHGHTQNDWFYAFCDELGVLVLQDSDLNWVFPADETFKHRAETVFANMILKLRQHPCIFAWVCQNETFADGQNSQVGDAVLAVAQRLDPLRPTIKDSCKTDDLASGDTHAYAGALSYGAYTDCYDKQYKLLSEFGCDAPSSPQNFQRDVNIARIGAKLLPQIAALHDYQYRVLKYHIEILRIRKYNPTGGYFQFMWIDLCPQSFYGVYDYWGSPKVEGRYGGALMALKQSNRPVGIFMEHKETPMAIWVVNDGPQSLGPCRATWRIRTAQGETVCEGSERIELRADASIRVSDLKFAFQPEEQYDVRLSLTDAAGRTLATNRYDDPFHHPQRLEGYPERIHPELGMRLWNG